MLMLITKYNVSSRWIQILIFLVFYIILLKLQCVDLNGNLAECGNTQGNLGDRNSRAILGNNFPTCIIQPGMPRTTINESIQALDYLPRQLEDQYYSEGYYNQAPCRTYRLLHYIDGHHRLTDHLENIRYHVTRLETENVTLQNQLQVQTNGGKCCGIPINTQCFGITCNNQTAISIGACVGSCLSVLLIALGKC